LFILSNYVVGSCKKKPPQLCWSPAEMGQGSDKMARVVLHTPEQTHFPGIVKDDAAEIVKGWFEDGAPLGLDLEGFESVTRLPSTMVQRFFDIFDTDRNQKVDAFEVLSAMVVLSNGGLEEKIDILLPVFDFSGMGQMNFDETNIFLHSICRGLQKVCASAPVEDQAVVSFCQSMFDSHNIPYSKHITSDQIKRWLRSDVDIARYLECFHGSLVLPECLKELDRLRQSQTKIMGELSGNVPVPVAVEDVLASRELLASLGSPHEDLARQVVTAAAGGGTSTSALPSRYIDGFSAWNIFRMVSPDLSGDTAAVELKNLLWLQKGAEPSDQIVDTRMAKMKLAEDARIPASLWIESSLATA